MVEPLARIPPSYKFQLLSKIIKYIESVPYITTHSAIHWFVSFGGARGEALTLTRGVTGHLCIGETPGLS